MPTWNINVFVLGGCECCCCGWDTVASAVVGDVAASTVVGDEASTVIQLYDSYLIFNFVVLYILIDAMSPKRPSSSDKGEEDIKTKKAATLYHKGS